MMPWTSFKYTLSQSQSENYAGSFSCTAKELVSQIIGQGHTVSIVGKKRSLKKRKSNCLFLTQKGFALGVSKVYASFSLKPSSPPASTLWIYLLQD